MSHLFAELQITKCVPGEPQLDSHRRGLLHPLPLVRDVDRHVALRRRHPRQPRIGRGGQEGEAVEGPRRIVGHQGGLAVEAEDFREVSGTSSDDEVSKSFAIVFLESIISSLVI